MAWPASPRGPRTQRHQKSSQPWALRTTQCEWAMTSGVQGPRPTPLGSLDKASVQRQALERQNSNKQAEEEKRPMKVLEYFIYTFNATLLTHKTWQDWPYGTCLPSLAAAA